MTEIGPLLATRLNNTNKILKPQFQSSQPIQSTIDSSFKPDSVELSTKTFDKKKLIKYGAIGVAFLGLAAGVAALIKKGKVSSEILSAQKSANKMEEEAKILASEAQKMLDDELDSINKIAQDIKDHAEKIKNEVVELFNNGGKSKEDIKAVNITELKDLSIMEEFDSAGNLFRKSTFIHNDSYNGLSGIEEISESNKITYDFFHNNKLCSYEDRKNNTPDGINIINRRLLFNEGNDFVREYMEGIESGACPYKAGKMITMQPNGKISTYCKNRTKLPDGTYKTDKIIWSIDNRLSFYDQDCLDFPDRTSKSGKSFEFDTDGNLLSYDVDLVRLPDGTQKSKKAITFNNGNALEYTEGWRRSQDGIIKADKTLVKEGSKWVEKH